MGWRSAPAARVFPVRPPPVQLHDVSDTAPVDASLNGGMYRLYAQKRGGWMTWEDAQKARVKCLEALEAYKGTDPKVPRYWARPLRPSKHFGLRKAVHGAGGEGWLRLHY